MAIGAVIGLVAAIQPYFALPLAGLSIGAALWFWNPVIGLAVLLASRSSLDFFQDATQDQRAFLFNPASGLGMLLIGIAIVLLGVRLRAGRPIVWGGKVGMAWGGWVLFCSFGLMVTLVQLGTSEFASAIREYVRLVSLFSLFFIVVNLASDSLSRRILLWATLAGIVIPVIVGAHQSIVGTTIHSIDGMDRIYGTFVHPNSFGMYLAALAIIVLGLWEDRFGGKAGRWALATTLLLAITFLIVTYSRSALGIFLFAVLLWGIRGSRRRKLITLAGVFGSSLAVLPFIAWRFADLFVSGDPSTERTNSFVWRLLNYRLLWDRFTDSPVVGFGLRSAGFVNPIRTASAEGYERGYAAHNEVVRVLVEQGVLGLLAYVAMAALLLSATRTHWRSGAGEAIPELPGLTRALHCLLWSLFLLCAIGSEFLAQTAILYAVFTVLGVLHASSLSVATTRPPHVEDSE